MAAERWGVEFPALYAHNTIDAIPLRYPGKEGPIMPEMPTPDFRKPPVIEVALSVQFERLQDFRIAHYGELWQEYKAEFHKTEEYPPIATVIEKFGILSPRKTDGGIEILESLPFPKCWFVNDSGTRLIQVQPDRFVFNWRKQQTDEEYPHYQVVRASFIEKFEAFAEFITKNKIGTVTPNQCEVTYVNHITAGEGWQDHREVHKVFTIWENKYSDTFLKEPEDVRFVARYQISGDTGKPVGRLYVNLDSGYLIKNSRPLFILSMISRGAPSSKGLEGVLGFMDRGREWIVRGFASITTPFMHRVWERFQ